GWPRRQEAHQRIVSRTALAAMVVNCYLNLGIAPGLLHYQSGSEVAFYSNRYYPGVPVVQLQAHNSSPLAFYLDQPLITMQQLADTEAILPRPYLVYAPQRSCRECMANSFKPSIFFLSAD